MLVSGCCDPFHYYLGWILPGAEIFLSLTLSRLRLTDVDVSHLPDAFHNLHTLSVVFNTGTNIGLEVLLRLASNVVTLDLEGNKMEFMRGSQACERLWRQNSPLRHLNVSHNSFTIQSLIGLFSGAGGSRLLMLDAVIPTHPITQVPARLLPYLLAKRMLEQVNL